MDAKRAVEIAKEIVRIQAKENEKYADMYLAKEKPTRDVQWLSIASALGEVVGLAGVHMERYATEFASPYDYLLAVTSAAQELHERKLRMIREAIEEVEGYARAMAEAETKGDHKH